MEDAGAGAWGSAGRAAVLRGVLFSVLFLFFLFSLENLRSLAGQDAYCFFTSVSSCNRMNITVG